MEYHQGKNCLDQGKLEQARDLFEKGYQAGDVRCAYGLLAVDAMAGKPRQAALQVLETVLPQLIAAAETGDGDALFILGRCVETGSVLNQDIGKAIGYYQKASAAGNTDAMYNLGCIYMQTGQPGEGIARDWYELAAKNGHDMAKMALQHWKQL